MKRFAVAICTCALASLLAGCAQPPAEDRFLSHWEKIVSLVSENKADAAKAEAAVRQYLKDHLEEMKALTTQFGKDAEKKLAVDPVFIRRVMQVIDDLKDLKDTNQALLNNTGLNEALAPLSEMMR